MKRKLLAVFILLFCLTPFFHLSGQEKQAKDKYTLLTMPYNQRPLTLYKGQLQINAGYRLAVKSKSYDSDGNKIILKTDGKASIMHTYNFELKYGITDFIEIGAYSYFMKNGVRSPSETYFSGSDVLNTNYLNEFKGIGDITVALATRLPLEYKMFDISLRGGVTLPIADFKPDQPTHSISDYTAPNNYTINYHFNNNNGNGVPLYFVSGAVKVTLSNISLEAGGSYIVPAKEGESIRWGWTLYGSKFTYYSNPYAYLPGRMLNINGSVHYQAAGWFDIFVGTYYTKNSSGWTEYYDLKYANPETSLVTIQPGFELQVSPALTIYQYAGIQVSGRSIDAPFYLLTSISFNLFPFWK